MTAGVSLYKSRKSLGVLTFPRYKYLPIDAVFYRIHKLKQPFSKCYVHGAYLLKISMERRKPRMNRLYTI